MMSWGFDGWLWLAGWIAALLVMVWLVVRAPASAASPDALELLRARFARGEIDEEQFRRARAVLLERR